MTGNIRQGNSLISGEPKELEKYFGRNYRDLHPFNWDEQFKEVFVKGGFDVVIGNPPWVSIKGKQKSLDFSEKELQYFFDKLNADTYRPNLFEMFIRKCLLLLKDDGLFSFIVPDRLCANEQFKNLREYILKNFCIKKLWFKVKFPGIIGDTVVFVIEKSKPKNNHIEIAEFPSTEFQKIIQSQYLKDENYTFRYVPIKILSIFEKIFSRSEKLGDGINSAVGFIAKSSIITQKRENKNQIKIVKGENIKRYGLDGNYFFDFKKVNLVGGTQDEKKLGEKNKIFLRKTGIDLIVSFDDSGIYPEQSLYFIYGKDKEYILFLLAVLNSNLMNIYYQNFAITNRDATPQLKKVDLDKFPIVLNEKSKKLLANYAQEMLDMNKKLQTTPENSEKWLDLKREIDKLDKKINEEVYKLYGLSEEEIKIIEGK